MNRTFRLTTGTLLITALLATGAGIVAWRGDTAVRDADLLRLQRPRTIVYVEGGRVRQASRQGKPVGTGPACQRAATAAKTLICLHALAGPLSSEVRVFRAGAASPTVTLPVWGEPSRARVSPSGNLVAWTVFRTGDAYLLNGQFSTTAGIYDLRSGAHYGSLEDFKAIVAGKPYEKDNRNFWGITFARDDRTFYVTMGSQGGTWLMRGDLTKRTVTALRRNVECPSLSPDGTRIAYKKRVGDRWRLHVLHLPSGTDTPLAETANIDDQVAWLNDSTVAYGKPQGRTPFIFSVPADGTGAPTKVFKGSSPSITTPEK